MNAGAASSGEPGDMLRKSQQHVEALRLLPRTEDGYMQRLLAMAAATRQAAQVKDAFYPFYNLGFDRQAVLTDLARMETVLRVQGSVALPEATIDLALAVERLLPEPGLSSRLASGLEPNWTSFFIVDELLTRLANWLDETARDVIFNDIVDEQKWPGVQKA